jgi:uncharacterized membrane protein YraQ (UPF0718 family)
MLSSFLVLFLSVVIEALPFLVLGTLIAVSVQRFGAFDRLVKALPQQSLLRRIAIAFLGVFLPVCECGNVPLSRSFMQRGFSVGEATTFLMAAPILNPITFVTTMEAFRGTPWVLWSRMLGGLVVALLVGWVVGRMRSPLTDDFAKTCQTTHRRKHRDGFSVQFGYEFWAMARLLIIGALIAASIQTFVPQQVFNQLGSNYLLGAITMVFVGFIVSICSNVDAFFALGFAGSFRYGSLVGFMIAGPMVDIKTIAMLSKTYRRSVLFVISGIVALSGVLIGWGLSYVG